MFTGLSPMNPADASVPFTADFSSVLASTETVASVVSVTATPSDIAVSTGTVIDGTRTACAVQFTLGAGTDGVSYEVTVEIRSSMGVQLARTLLVPVRATT
jgi:hypothetical protein